MKELTLKLDKDLSKLSGANRKKTLQAALDAHLKEIEAQEAAKEKLKNVYQDVAKILSIPIENTTELVIMLLPHTSHSFRSQLGSIGEEVSKGKAKAKKKRKTNNVKKDELTDKEIDLIEKAKEFKDVNPIPHGTKNAGKNLPFRAYTSIKGIKI